MRFAVSNCDGYDRYMTYKSVLEKYNLEVEKAKEEWDDDGEEYELYHITINTLEELMQLKSDVKNEIILEDECKDNACNFHKEPTIRIWDGYID